ncbi:MAG: YcgL domain-containing protein [Parashewanella sp.]
MICAVYKSSRKAETYLFVAKKGDFSNVPDPLMEMFGTPQLIMLIPLDKREKLGFADIGKVRSELAEKSFYLQLPPPQDNLLAQHRSALGLKD